MRTFDTAEDQGHYDFLTGLITLDKFDGKDLPKLATALLAIPAPELSPEAIELRELRALIKHEITHFLDQTTTCWGIEFMIRKCRLLNAIEKGEDTSQAMEVFWLNASEMQMHHDLVKSHVPVALVSCDTITHRLLHDERHGAIILVSFFKQRRLVHDVPISMLSLLESNGGIIHSISSDWFAQQFFMFSAGGTHIVQLRRFPHGRLLTPRYGWSFSTIRRNLELLTADLNLSPNGNELGQNFLKLLPN
ncbi:hypothetical protein HUX88_09445 [Duganella sp. BJB1802]|uniref:hypothetical protein n=1 Tax=Duganella sp. BJB1802 TaxID=2744575 RepID=UPI00159459C8|nr:hypothetical protein [Duganella sp. BJB1802]NVD70785.1 hypothetical protein [Duganella sp. BJB1802]